MVNFISYFSKPWGIFLFGSLFVLVLWTAYAQFEIGGSTAEAGQFGDKFGALNTLFTGIALVGLLATLKHQQDEISTSKEDIDRILKALVATTQSLNSQNHTAKYNNYMLGLVSRIEGYTRQQDLYSGKGQRPIPSNLVSEQDALLRELDKALAVARVSARMEANQEPQG